MFSKRKIAVFESNKLTEKLFKEKLRDFSCKFFDFTLSSKNLSEVESKIKDCEVLSVFIHSKIDSAVIDAMPKLKLIATRSTGFDHIDVEYAKSKNISVCTVPKYGDKTVAEHTFALILALSKKLKQTFLQVNEDNFSTENLMGFDLEGKIIGLIGTGNISSHVAKIANSFDMKILAHDLKINTDLVRLYGAKYVPLENLLRQADIVSLHLPLNEHTKHIINSKNIYLLKENAILVNTARGGLIDTTALCAALKKNKIGGAALDVIEEENFFLEKNDLELLRELLKFENVVISPHNAFNTFEANKRILDFTSENISFFFLNKPKNLI